jgi:hypothetical protein
MLLMPPPLTLAVVAIVVVALVVAEVRIRVALVLTHLNQEMKSRGPSARLCSQ